MIEVKGNQCPEPTKLPNTIQMIDATHSTTEAVRVRREEHLVNNLVSRISILIEVDTKDRTIFPKAFVVLETTTNSKGLNTKSNIQQVEVMILNHLTTKVNLEVQQMVLPRNVATTTTKSNSHKVEVMTSNQLIPSVVLQCNCQTLLFDFKHVCTIARFSDVWSDFCSFSSRFCDSNGLVSFLFFGNPTGALKNVCVGTRLTFLAESQAGGSLRSK